MTTSILNTSGRCERCGAKVSNIEGRRRTREQLAETHYDTCPGVTRGGRRG